MSRRSSTRSVTQLGAQMLSLDPKDRRELAFQLVWSLPRDDVVMLNERLSKMLQKDIVAALPVELAVQILGHLPLEDLMQCALVSRTWAEIFRSQTLWIHLCNTHRPPILPAQTTWDDLRCHRALAYSRPKAHRTSTTSLYEDDSVESDDAEYTDVISSQGGLGGGGGLDPLPISTGPALRRSVWERSTHSSTLPTHHRYRPSRFSKHTKHPKPAPTDSKQNTGELILSDLGTPGPTPQVNYRHLYIAHHKLSQRVRHFTPTARSSKPIILDAISSIEAGGLPGHSEIIYSLDLVRHRMTVKMDRSDAHGTPSGPYDTLMTLSGLSRGPPAYAPQSDSTVHGRDWLLSGSRDRTMRLWTLNEARPRVVKVFHGGHEGSVLSHYVIRTAQAIVPGDDDDHPPTEEGEGGEGKVEKMMIVSAGSDGRICLWDIEDADGRPAHVIEAHKASVLCVRGNQEHIVSCSKDRSIRLFSMKTLEELLVIELKPENGDGPRGVINAVGLSADYIVSGSGDKAIRVWCIKTGACLASIEPHVRGIASISFEPSVPANITFRPRFKNCGARHLGTIVTGSSDCSVKTFNLVMYDRDPRANEPSTADDSPAAHWRSRSTQNLSPCTATADSQTSLVIEKAYSCSAACVCPPGLSRPDGQKCGRCLNRGHMELVRSVWLTGETLISGSYDGSVKVWDRQSGKALADLSGSHSGRVFSAIGDKVRVASSGLDCRIVLWDFGQGIDTSFVRP